MNKYIPFFLIAIILSCAWSFNYAYAVDNNCLINPVHIIQLRIALGCMEDRLDTLENASSSDLTTASNLGSVGEGVFSSEVGNDLQFKKLVAGNGVTLNANSSRIMINSTGGSGESTICSNVGTGRTIHVLGSNCNAKSLIGSSDINITNSSNTITIDFNGTASGESTVCTNQGTGKQIFKDGNCNFRTLTNTSRIWLTQNTNDILLDPSYTGAMQIDTYSSLTKTNIGTVYADIYVTAFDIENRAILHCQNVTSIYIIWQWDYVGVGTQSLRWVDIPSQQVVYETIGFVVDQDSNSSGWFTRPSWCINTYQIEQQGKSTTGTDDPIAKGYRIYTR